MKISRLKKLMSRVGMETKQFEKQALAAIEALAPITGKRYPERPKGAGVYAIWRKSDTMPIWVGRTNNFFHRTYRHIQDGIYNPDKHFVTTYDCDLDKVDLLDLESVLIVILKPEQNTFRPWRRNISDDLINRLKETLPL